MNNMGKIDISTWKPFKIGGENGLFTVVKGKRLTRANMHDGVINFIGSSAENNGITNHIRNRENLHSGNLITVSYNGSVGEAFYQEQEFVASDDVNVLYPKFTLNKYIGLFLCSVLRVVGKNYVFINKWKKEDMENDSIYLPVCENGQPDWNYIETYMRMLEKKVQYSITALQTKNIRKSKKRNISSWQFFLISDLFEIRSPASRSIKSYDEGNIPYVSSSSVNNGVISYLKPKMNEKLERGGCITVSPLDGSSFYQEDDFLGRGGAGSAISLLYNPHITRYSALFICTVIKKTAQKFDYSDALTSDNLRTLKIKLPAVKRDVDLSYDKEKEYTNNEYVPDWDEMERYMKYIEQIVDRKIKIL